MTFLRGIIQSTHMVEIKKKNIKLIHSERLVSNIIKELNLNKDHYKAKQIRNRISSLKNNFITASYGGRVSSQ